MLCGILSCIVNTKHRLPTPLLTLAQKPAALSLDAQLDMIQKVGADTLHRIGAKLKMHWRNVGYMKKKITAELAEFGKELAAGLTRAKEAIQTMFSSKASGSGSSGHAAIQKHFDELLGAISRLGMLDLTAKAYTKT